MMKWWKRIFALFLMLVVSLSLSGAVFAQAASTGGGRDERQIRRFLFLGCDESTRLCDSILVVTVDEKEHRASVLQLPRDTYAEYTTKDYKKLNGAMQALGASEMKRFLSDVLGVPIHYFVTLRLDCFRDLVDAVGGVDLTVEQDMIYSDPSQNLEINLTKGTHHLTGKTAEHFVRYRSGYVRADLDRLDAQKYFLRAFAESCRSLSPVEMLRVFSVALRGASTDAPIPDAIRVIRALYGIDPLTVEMKTLPGQACQGKSGAWYYVADRAASEGMIEALLLPPTHVTFDPLGKLDREHYAPFHEIYIGHHN